MKFLLFNILLVAIFQFESSIEINQSLLIQKYGFNIDSVVIDLSGRYIDTIEINTFIGYTKLEKILFRRKQNKAIRKRSFQSLRQSKRSMA